MPRISTRHPELPVYCSAETAETGMQIWYAHAAQCTCSYATSPAFYGAKISLYTYFVRRQQRPQRVLSRQRHGMQTITHTCANQRYTMYKRTYKRTDARLNPAPGGVVGRGMHDAVPPCLNRRSSCAAPSFPLPSFPPLYACARHRTCSGSMTRYVWKAATAQPRSMKVVAVPLNLTTPYVRERMAQARKRSKLKPHASETRVQYSFLPRLVQRDCR